MGEYDRAPFSARQRYSFWAYYTVAVCLTAACGSEVEAPTPSRRVVVIDSNVGPAQLGRIIGAAELPDGTWLLSDFDARSVLPFDPTTGVGAPIGRSGPGPGEYLRPAALWRLGGDSVLMVNQLERRWDVFVGRELRGRLEPLGRPNSVLLSYDTLGGLVVVRSGQNPGDSQFVVRVDRASGRERTIARLEPPPPMYPGLPPPFPGQYDDAAVAPDGWVAIRRADPYRVDWVRPDGVTIPGAPLPVETVPLTAEEREFYLGTLSPGRRGQIAVDAEWPESVPPVMGSGILFAPGGDAVIERVPSTRLPGRVYDVIGRDGRLRFRVELPRTIRILQFGRERALALIEDDDGLVSPTFLDWPPSP